jgi:hypothetical protein
VHVIYQSYCADWLHRSNAQSAVASSITILASRCEAMHLENLDLMSKSRDSLHNIIFQQGQEFHLMLSELKQLKSQEIEQLKAQKSQRGDSLNIPSDPSNTSFGLIEDAHRVATPEATKAFDRSLTAMAKQISDMLSGAEATSAALSILKSLAFREMPMRHMEINPTFGQTYTWIFKEQATGFAAWLKHRNGIFWISGKAGSGKSTLMKFLASHRRTQDLLQSWSQGKRVCTPAFYFWNSGFAMQKSQLGLLQSLLYQVYKAFPATMGPTCAVRWRLEDLERLEPPPWSLEEASKCFRAALAYLEPTSRFCIFIDGLDELEGDHYELVTYLEDLAKYSHVKICVSCRPWNVFRRAYANEQTNMVKLEDLTRKDMEIYVSGKLQSDPRYVRLARTDPSANLLAQEIHQRADGVFLWVFLVIRSLLRGLSEDDDIPTLYRRLRALPQDLRSWFRHMLDGIDEIYSGLSSRSLLVACIAEGPLPVLSFWHVELEMTHPMFAFDAAVEAITPDTYDARLYSVSGLVNKWCRDLLEVRKTMSEKRPQNAQQPLGPADTEQRGFQALDQHRVEFLHRSVKDFLTEPEIQALLCQRAGESFSPRLTILQSYVAQCKALAVERENTIDLSLYRTWATQAVFYARAYEETSGTCPTKELDEISRVGDIWQARCGNRRVHWSNEEDFLAFVKKHGIERYQEGTSAHLSPDMALDPGQRQSRKRDRLKGMFSRGSLRDSWSSS